MSFNLNWGAFVVGVVLYQALGALWYSTKVFGNPWMEGIGKDPESLGDVSPTKSLVTALIDALITTFILTNFLQLLGTDTLISSVVTTFWLWVGFTGTTILTNSAFEGRTIKLWSITAGYHLVGMLLISAVYGLWQ